VHDPLAAQDLVLQWLKAFAAGADVPDRPQLAMLMQVDERCAANTAVLAAHYINTPALAYEDEERHWEAVHGNYHHFSRVYQAFITAAVDWPELPLIVARALHHFGQAAKWHYLRYQPIPEGDWLRTHKLYQLAERGGFAGQAVQLGTSGVESTCTAAYLQALMLDTLSRTDLTKQEIDLVDGWLAGWVRPLALEQQFEEEWQLFYVDLAADRGGRRIRNFEPTPNCRYWDTDSVVRMVERARTSLHQGEQPAGIDVVENKPGVDYPRLLHHLLTEWSRDAYQRQRRTEERGEVKKRAEAMHGIFGVCQHVKNVMFARRSDASALGAAMPEFEGQDEGWVIENESPNGFGAVADPEIDTWLKVGRLIALDYEKNKDMTVVGVVRNINQQPDGKCYVGIEALSHTPTYVLLCAAQTIAPAGDISTEALHASTLSFEGMSPFPAVYLPRNDAKNTPSTLVMPVIELVAAGVFEMRMENHPYLVRFGAAMEQQDDWVRVEVKEVKTTGKKN